jgi:hypothetical protein
MRLNYEIHPQIEFLNIMCPLVATCMILRRLEHNVHKHEGVNSILGYIYTKVIRPWLLGILEFLIS